MEVVLYTDDMEPITVINIPVELHAHAEKHGLCIPYRPPMLALPKAEEIPRYERYTVRIWAERFTRNGMTHLFFFTSDEELALALKAEMLAGQRKEVHAAFERGMAEGACFIIKQLPKN